MGRQEKTRTIDSPPRFFIFSAEEAPSGEGELLEMGMDEFEALRLADKLGYNHPEAAAIMDISRPTFTRLLNRAREKMARFLIDGARLEIRGGSISFSSHVLCCRDCRRPFRAETAGTTSVPGGPVTSETMSERVRCPRCAGDNVQPARAACNHDCRCCDTAAGDMLSSFSEDQG